MLPLVLPAAVFVRGLAHLIAFEEQHLRTAFARVDLGRQRRGVAEFERHIAFPFGLERRDVDDDPAPGVGTLAQADREHIARNAEVLDGARERETVGRNDADIALDIDETLFVEILRVDDGAVDVGEHLEFVSAANVVAVTRRSITDDALVLAVAIDDRTDLARLEGFDHAVLARHAANPLVGLDAHAGFLA